MFSTFLCKENLLMYSAYCHIKQISWCCCNYFVQWTEIQSMSENQTTSAEIVLCRIPIMFSASNHLVLAACMLKGPFSFVRKPFFIQLEVYLKGNCTRLFTSTGHLNNVFQDDVYVSLKKDTTSFLVLFTSI